MGSHPHHWAIILAGGEGRRMASVTRDEFGAHVPKQFCQFGGAASLLELALVRAEHVVDPHQVIVVVQASHRHWWEPALASHAQCHVVWEPVNRGTAVAVLEGLAHVLACDREPYVVVLPADQEVDDECAWRETIRRSLHGAMQYPDGLIMIGVEAQPDPGFGWIVPGEPAVDGTRAVAEFVEKPPAELARQLKRRGALCSAFVFAASARALLRLYVRHAAGLIGYYEERIRCTGRRSPRLRRAFERLPACDFSHDILEQARGEVRVLPSPPCGWTDLGTPERLERWIERREAGHGRVMQLSVRVPHRRRRTKP